MTPRRSFRARTIPNVRRQPLNPTSTRAGELRLPKSGWPWPPIAPGFGSTEGLPARDESAGSDPPGRCDGETPVGPENRRFSGVAPGITRGAISVWLLLPEGAIRPARTVLSERRALRPPCDSGCDSRPQLESRSGAAQLGAQRAGRCLASTTFAARVASLENVTHLPQKDRTAFPADVVSDCGTRRVPVGAVGHPSADGPQRWAMPALGGDPLEPGPRRTYRQLLPEGTPPKVAITVRRRTPVTEPRRYSPRSTTGGPGGRAAGEAMPFPRQRSLVGLWAGAQVGRLDPSGAIMCASSSWAAGRGRGDCSAMPALGGDPLEPGPRRTYRQLLPEGTPPKVAITVRRRTPVTEPRRYSPRSTTGGPGGRAAGEAMPCSRVSVPSSVSGPVRRSAGSTRRRAPSCASSSSGQRLVDRTAPGRPNGPRAAAWQRGGKRAVRRRMRACP